MRNAGQGAEWKEERDMRLPRYVTRARDVTGPVTRAPCAPGHVSCHALVPPFPFPCLPSLLSSTTASLPPRGYRPSLSSSPFYISRSLLLLLRSRSPLRVVNSSFFLSLSLSLRFGSRNEIHTCRRETADSTSIQARPRRDTRTRRGA